MAAQILPLISDVNDQLQQQQMQRQDAYRQQLLDMEQAKFQAEQALQPMRQQILQSQLQEHKQALDEGIMQYSQHQLDNDAQNKLYARRNVVQDQQDQMFGPQLAREKALAADAQNQTKVSDAQVLDIPAKQAALQNERDTKKQTNLQSIKMGDQQIASNDLANQMSTQTLKKEKAREPYYGTDALADSIAKTAAAKLQMSQADEQTKRFGIVVAQSAQPALLMNTEEARRAFLDPMVASGALTPDQRESLAKAPFLDPKTRNQMLMDVKKLAGPDKMVEYEEALGVIDGSDKKPQSPKEAAMASELKQPTQAVQRAQAVQTLIKINLQMEEVKGIQNNFKDASPPPSKNTANWTPGRVYMVNDGAGGQKPMRWIDGALYPPDDKKHQPRF